MKAALGLEGVAERFGAGQPVLVSGVDGESSAVAVAAATIDADRLALVHELGSGMVVLGLEPATAERLRLSAVAAGRASAPGHPGGLRLTLPVDAADCRQGGWRLADRAHTIHVAADAGSGPDHLSAPGHVHTGTVDPSRGGTAAVALELARAAGRARAVVLSSVLDRAGQPVPLAEARAGDRLRRLPVAPAAELHGLALTRSMGEEMVTCSLPTPDGDFRLVATSVAGEGNGGETTMTLVHGDPGVGGGVVVRRHVACLLGDTFGSLLCDCRHQLERSVAEITAAGAGMLIYVKPAGAQPLTCPQAGAAGQAGAAAGLDAPPWRRSRPPAHASLR